MTKILVVEDDKMFLRVVVDMLGEQLPAAKVDTATEGLEALRKIVLADQEFDLVIADVDMQPVNGDDLDAIIGILKHRNVFSTRMLMMSGKVATRPGDYLDKPFSADELGAKVGEILDRD